MSTPDRVLHSTLDAPWLPAGGDAHVGRGRLRRRAGGAARYADAAYAWPAPDAYFTVWHCPVDGAEEGLGVWLPVTMAEDRLGRRHWWPLLRHLLDPADPAGSGTNR